MVSDACLWSHAFPHYQSLRVHGSLKNRGRGLDKAGFPSSTTESNSEEIVWQLELWMVERHCECCLRCTFCPNPDDLLGFGSSISWMFLLLMMLACDMKKECAYRDD